MNHTAPLQAQTSPSTQLVRPQFLLPAWAAFAFSLVMLVAMDWLPVSFSFFIVPACVLGCRYYELARFQSVHLSGWLLLIILWCSIASVVWTIGHRTRDGNVPLEIALALAWLGFGVHLFVIQRRLQAELIAQRLQDPLEEGFDWACGGFLAITPIFFVGALVSGLAGWRHPWPLLWGLLGAGLLVLQLRQHRLFPRLALGWLGLRVVAEVLATKSSEFAEWSEGNYISFFSTLVVIGALGLYLEFAPRVRRTFARQEE